LPRRPPRLGVVAVHYRIRRLLIDQHRRLRDCVGATRQRIGHDLWYFPVVHDHSRPDIVAAAGEMSSPRRPLPAVRVDLRGRPLVQDHHKGYLLAAYRKLRRRLAPSDLVAVMDHDVHPLRADALAALAERLLATGAAGIGIPQWHRGHCYLHPSFLLARVETIDEMGPELAYASRRGGRKVGDTGEGFTVWCEEHGRPLSFLRVVSTAFPWRCWDSAMALDRGTELRGEHGEPVHVGHLMRYGLPEGPALLSHVWLSPLGTGYFSDHEVDEVLAAYLAEPTAT
jgi:hypothetical protein